MILRTIKKIAFYMIVIVFLAFLMHINGWFRYDHITPDFENLDNYIIVYYDNLEKAIRFVSKDGEVSSPYEIKVTSPGSSDRDYGNAFGYALFTWSPDGNYLAFRARPYSPSGVPVLMTISGEFIKCETDDLPVAQYRVWVVEGMKVISPDKSGTKDKVVIYDFETCQITEVLYEGDEEESLIEATISSIGWLAISRWTKENGYEIIIIDSDKKEYVIKGGENPSWSKDGNYLAFVIDNKGVLFADKYGKNATIVEIDIVGSRDNFPTWSPDGDWIAHSEHFKIFKTNIHTGEKILIAENGAFPNWRWK